MNRGGKRERLEMEKEKGEDLKEQTDRETDK